VDDTDFWTRCDLLTPKEFTRRADAQPLAEVLESRLPIQPHAINYADAVCDSSVTIRVIRGSTLRFNHGVQRTIIATRPPPNQGMAKSAIHSDTLVAHSINANELRSPGCGE